MIRFFIFGLFIEGKARTAFFCLYDKPNVPYRKIRVFPIIYLTHRPLKIISYSLLWKIIKENTQIQAKHLF